MMDGGGVVSKSAPNAVRIRSYMALAVAMVGRAMRMVWPGVMAARRSAVTSPASVLPPPARSSMMTRLGPVGAKRHMWSCTGLGVGMDGK